MIGHRHIFTGASTPPPSGTAVLRRLFGALALMTIALACSMAAPAPAAAQSEQSIVMLVNDDPISAYDIEQRTRFLAITSQQQPNAELKKKAEDMLIEERLQIQQGKELKVFPDEADVNKVVSNMASKNKLTADGLAAALGKAGINIKTLKDRIRAQLVWQDVIVQKFRHTVNVGESDIDEALSQADTGSVAQNTNLALLKIRFSARGDAAIARQLAQADTLRTRFRTCERTEALVKDFPGASMQTINQTRATNVPQPARTMLMHADVNTMIAPTISSGSVDVYVLCGKESTSDVPLERDTAKRELMTKEMKVSAEKLLRDLKNDAYIERR
ncbi:Chaperone SurA precursor [Methyloligella halotolerans]|uniref:Chaperone SurA n=1 Tax=Methyloligella halotolerans TaxID=1177755 RepID=A0A1E2S250_9HYPH|nr:SurA N-terminal domain-containing protein [Methyloligella halotolerans]ODA68428.1 Chaperone SurA precursor [Methyloligella halotolerans]